MKGFVFSLLVAAILCAVRARADVLFYGGDFIGSEWYANALANENDQSVHGNPYGAAVLSEFCRSSWPDMERYRPVQQ